MLRGFSPWQRVPTYVIYAFVVISLFFPPVRGLCFAWAGIVQAQTLSLPSSPLGVKHDFLPPPPITSGSIVLLDVSTGTILVTEEAHSLRAPGGLTKLMTALTVLDYFETTESAYTPEWYDQPVVISRDAAYAPGYNLLLDTGEVVAAGELFRAMLLLPGTDAAIALAEHVAGSTYAFVGMMNERLDALGLQTSHFQNAHGLDAEAHKATAHDLAVIAHELISRPEIRSIVGEKHFRLNVGVRKDRITRNTNAFLWRYPGAMGILSAYTPESGYSLAAAARKEDKELLVIVVGAPSADARFQYAKDMLDYGFVYYDRLMETPRIDRVPTRGWQGETVFILK